MTQIKYLPEIPGICFIDAAIHKLVFPQPILIANNNPASITEIPGKKGIGIKIIHIVGIRRKGHRPGVRVSFIIKVHKSFFQYITPVMPNTKGKIDAWGEIVYTR